MAQNLTSLTITDPTSDPNISTGNSFTFEVTPGFGGSGGITAYDLDFQWDQGTGTWTSITTSGGLSTSDTNPIASTTSELPTSITVTGNSGGSYSIRVVNTSRAITSGEQAVTVTGASLQTSYPTALDTTEAFGTPTLTAGSVTISVTALDTGEAFGSPTVSTPTLYYVIYSSALGPPSEAQIKAGQDVNGDPAVASGSESSPTTDQTYTFSADASGLTAATAYKIAFVWSDGTYDSNIAVSDEFTTGAGADTMYPTGLATDEAFGSFTLTTGPVTVSMTALDTDEAFGTPVVTSRFTVYPTALDTDEAFGEPTVTAGQVTIALNALDTDEAFGSFTLTPGATTVSMTALDTDEAFGTPHLKQVLYVTALDTDEAFGSPTLTVGQVTVTPNALDTDEAFGNFIITQGDQSLVYPTALDTDEGFGTLSLSSPATVYPTALDTDEAFGSFTISSPTTVSMTALDTDEAFGSFTLNASATTVTMDALDTDEAFGEPTIDKKTYIYMTGKDTDEAFGEPTVYNLTQYITPTGKATDQAFGSFTITGGIPSATDPTYGPIKLVAISLDGITLEDIELK